jgi:hypothetical protein
MGTESKASLDRLALAMMSKTYFFELTNPLHPLLKTIGNARVTAVVINESSSPELLLQPDGEEPAFYHVEELSFSPALAIAV